MTNSTSKLLCVSRNGCATPNFCRDVGHCTRLPQNDASSSLTNMANIPPGLLRELPPEFDDATKEGMRIKARRTKLEHESWGDMSDEWLANELRMLSRNDLWHESFCTAGRDRIMRLSIQLAEARGIIDKLKNSAHDTTDLQQTQEQVRHLERRIRELTEQLNCIKLDSFVVEPSDRASLVGWYDRAQGVFLDVREKPIRTGEWIPFYTMSRFCVPPT